MPSNPAINGLQTAVDPLEQQIKQRQAINQGMAGQQPAPLPGPMAQFHLNPQLPDPSGMIEALKQAGYTGQRMGDIPLAEPQQSVDELRKRIDVLMGGVTR